MAKAELTITIGTHNEGHCISYLLGSLVDYRKQGGLPIDIVVVDDFSQDHATLNALDKHSRNIRVFQRHLNEDFGSQKNFMNSKATTDWILNIDADEWVSFKLLWKICKSIQNTKSDIFTLPRLNIVEGITSAHLEKWRWNVTKLSPFSRTEHENELKYDIEFLKTHKLLIRSEGEFITYFEPIINWPDHKRRLFKNSQTITWQGTVHEKIVGFTSFDRFPTHPDSAIIHRKVIQKQESQNLNYSALLIKRNQPFEVSP